MDFHSSQKMFDSIVDQPHERVLRSIDPTQFNSTKILESQNETYELVIDDSDWESGDKVNQWLSTFLPFAGRNINAQIVGERSKVFKKAIQLLSSRQDLMKEAHMELRGDLVLALRIIADNFNKTSININNLHDLLQQTTQQLPDIIQSFRESMNLLQQKVKSIRFLSILTNQYLQLWTLQFTQYKDLDS